MIGVAAVSLSGPQATAAPNAPALALDRFRSLARRLCDAPLGSRTFAADLLSLLTHEYSAERLVALADYVDARGNGEIDFRAAGFDRLVARLVSVAYSGLAPMQKGKERILTYTDAAVWAATGYAKPPSYCGEAFGEWGAAPAAILAGR
jgi:hypothetical protein